MLNINKYLSILEENKKGEKENMDYKKAAEELFEIVILNIGVEENIEAFNFLCNKYPELMNAYVEKIEKELEDSNMPEITDEELKASWEKLCARIRAEYGENAI